MSELKAAMQEYSGLVDEKLDMLLPKVSAAQIGESRLAEAMRYTVLSPGKRLRPCLVIMAADLFGVSRPCSVQAAAGIELIHAYSLIHDDLPALDDDDTRRGQPSLHIKFDEATAILAGDGLLTLAFEVMADHTTHPDGGVRAELVRSVARAIGPFGMVAGQMMDIMSETRELSVGEVNRMQRLKTGELFAISCEMGAILGKASPSLRAALRKYANDVGLAFQITDDILDIEVGHEEGSTRKDKSAGKGTFITAMGMDAAKRQAAILCDQACVHLNVFGRKADLLKEIAKFVVNRTK